MDCFEFSENRCRADDVTDCPELDDQDLRRQLFVLRAILTVLIDAMDPMLLMGLTGHVTPKISAVNLE